MNLTSKTILQSLYVLAQKMIQTLTKLWTEINCISCIFFQVAVKALAEFHGVCIAFDQLSEEKLVDLYPILDPKYLMWIQEDMLKFLKSTVATAETFISSIEGEGQTAR